MSLAGLIEKHGEELESDLIRFCSGTDLAGLWTGGLSWRRLGVLIKFLPPESAIKTVIRNETPLTEIRQAVVDAEYGSWSQAEMLLARIGDGIDKLFWAKTKDATEGRNQPEPFPRPGVPRKKTDTSNDGGVIDLLEYIRSHNGAVPQGYSLLPDGAAPPE